jgi:hypothetical protein
METLIFRRKKLKVYLVIDFKSNEVIQDLTMLLHLGQNYFKNNLPHIDWQTNTI